MNVHLETATVGKSSKSQPALSARAYAESCGDAFVSGAFRAAILARRRIPADFSPEPYLEGRLSLQHLPRRYHCTGCELSAAVEADVLRLGSLQLVTYRNVCVLLDPPPPTPAPLRLYRLYLFPSSNCLNKYYNPLRKLFRHLEHSFCTSSQCSQNIIV